MNWYDVLQQVQSAPDARRMGLLMSAMWAALANGPEWVLTNALMNTYPAFNLAQSLDGASVAVTAEARALAR